MADEHSPSARYLKKHRDPFLWQYMNQYGCVRFISKVVFGFDSCLGSVSINSYLPASQWLASRCAFPCITLGSCGCSRGPKALHGACNVRLISKSIVLPLYS